mmetsp:Transcript_9782/g.20353  ORF Transcript_9782/g.20353 Transcript_9782/m.20353 type:complete len:229 (-) Transcript_9782:346-1032(-)
MDHTTASVPPMYPKKHTFPEEDMKVKESTDTVFMDAVRDVMASYDLSHYAFTEDVLIDMSDDSETVYQTFYETDYETGSGRTADRHIVIRFDVEKSEPTNEARVLLWDSPPAIVRHESILHFIDSQKLEIQDMVCEVYDSSAGRYITLDDTVIVSFPADSNEMLMDLRLIRQSDDPVRYPCKSQSWKHRYERSFVPQPCASYDELCANKPKAVIFQQSELNIARGHSL